MNTFALTVLIGWPFVTMAVFAFVPARTAVLVAYVGGFLFLPGGSLEFSGLPEFTKFTATAAGALFGALAFDFGSFRKFRLSLLDLPMLSWCVVVPIATSLSNDLGLYDGAANAFSRITHWGTPYLMGRVYFRDVASLRLLAKALVVAGVLYVPLCLWEIRMSPQLHATFYGFYQRPFLYVMRYGGYRPIVFMQSGLAVGMLMAAASIASYWLFRSKAVLRIRGVPLAACFPVLAITVVLGKTSGAITLVLVGVALFTVFRTKLARLALVSLLVLVTTYPALRISGVLSGERVLAIAGMFYPEERVSSLDVRMRSEDLMTEKAMLRPAFGWGGYGRSEVHNSRGRSIAIPDGLWLIAVSQNGLLGLISLMSIYLIPPALLLRRHAPKLWTHPSVAPVTMISLILIFYWVDSLANAMLNLILVLGIGGLAGYHGQATRRRAPVRRKAPQHEGSVAHV